MTKYDSVYELAAKADWEGGLTSFFFGYGLDLDDLPDATPPAIRTAFQWLETLKHEVDIIGEWLDEALQAGDPEDDHEERMEH